MTKRQIRNAREVANIARLKEKFLSYYAKMPIKRYGAYYVGRDEDTILLWEKNDSEFSERIKELKAEYLLQKAKTLRSEFIIPLLFRELTPRQEITGKDGKDLQPVLVKFIEKDDKGNIDPDRV